MATDLFLHIGPPKTGTTYLQGVLWRNRDVLREQGVLVPGRSPVHHFHAAVDLLERDPTAVGADDTSGAWRELVEEVRGWDGRVVVSHENFGFADADAVARAKADLAGTTLHVVHTARAMTAVAPAAWQERLKNREADGWSAFLTALTANPSTSPFWRQHAGPSLQEWADGLDPEHVHVVTVPPADASPALLWERFAGVLGVEASSCDTAVERTNESLGIDEAAFLRHFNARAGAALDWPVYRAGVKHALADVLARRPEKRRILATGRDAAVFAERGEELRRLVVGSGFHLVGDLDDLVDPEATLLPVQDNDDVSAEGLQRAAEDAVSGLASDLVSLQTTSGRRVRRLRGELDAARTGLDEAHAEQTRLRAELKRVRARLADAEQRAGLAEQRNQLALWRLAAHRMSERSAPLGRLRDAVQRRRRAQ